MTVEEAGAVMTREAHPVRPHSGLERTRRAVTNPLWATREGLALARARAYMRACNRLGPRPRLFGRCKVVNYGTIEIGERLLMYGEPVRCDLNAHAGGRLEIGERVFFNFGCSVSAHTLVRIGNGCLIGQYSIILDCDYHDPDGASGHGRPRPIVVGDRVWMGARVTVLKGVTIGAGSVIGTGSVVTRDIPPGVLAVGVPAEVVRPL